MWSGKLLEIRAHSASHCLCLTQQTFVYQNICLSISMLIAFFPFFFLTIHLFSFRCVGSSLLCAGFSLVAASGGYSLLQCADFFCCGARALGAWAQQLCLAGSRAQTQQLGRTGLVAPQHVGSSRTRAQTRVPCIGRRILNHCATREALPSSLLKSQTTTCNIFFCLELKMVFKARVSTILASD